MAKSWEEIKKERGYLSPDNKLTEIIMPKTYTTRPTKSFDTTVEPDIMGPTKWKENPLPNVKKKTWEDIRRERGYVEPEPEPVNEWKEHPVKSAALNAWAGFGDLGRATAGVADMLGGSNVPLVKDWIDVVRRDSAAEDEKLNSINNSSKYGNIYGGIARGIGQSTTSLALGVAGAPIAGANPLLTSGGTQLVSNAAQLANPSTLNAVKTVSNNLIRNPNFIPSMIQGVGSQYEQAINNGATRQEAIKTALIGGVPSGLIEVSGGLETLSSKLASKSNGFFATAARSALEEGLEEVLQYPVENYGHKVSYDKNMPMFSIKDPAVFNPIQMAEAGFIGGAVGGIMGGSGAGINNAINKRYSKQINKEYERVINSLPDNSAVLQTINNRIENIRSNNANVTDDVKVWAINLAYQSEDFQSETDKLLRNNQPIAQSMVNESNLGEQLDNNQESFVKTQNMASDGSMPNLNVFGIKNVSNPTEVKSKVQNYYKDLISTSEISKPIMNNNTGALIEVSRASINQTFGADEKFRTAADNDIKIAAMKNIIPLIENGNMQIVDTSEKPSSKVIFATINGDVIVNGIPHAVSLEVRRTDTGNKMFVHSIKTDVGQVQLTENKKSGMINNGYENQIDPIAYSILDRIGQTTGMKIKVVPQIDIRDNQGTVLQANAGNGQYDPKTQTMEISMTADNPMLVVAKHEITHMLEQKAPEAHKEYKDYIINSMKKNGTYDAIYADYELRYKLMGINLSESEIQDEIVADATETFLTDKTAIDNLVRENKTLGQKILDIIREFIKKVDEAVKGVTTGWMGTEQFRVAERMWVEALNSVAKNERNRIKKANLNQNDSLGRPLSDSFDNSISRNDKNDNNKFSLKYDEDNNPVVFIDTNIFEGREGKKHDIIANYIADHIGEMYTIIESGQKVYIGEDLPGEYTESKYTRRILHNKKFLNVKHQAAQNLGELIEIASNRDWAKNTKEKHKIDAKYGFYYYTSKLAVKAGNNHADKYTVKLVIRNDANGKKYLYDIQNIKNAGTMPLTSTQKGQLWGDPKVTALPANNSISQNNENDNNNFEKNIESGENLNPDDNIRYSIRKKEPPKKTITAYKLFRIDKRYPGKLFPLFVNSTNEVPVGVWLDAEEGEMVVDEKTGTKKVKSKLGNLAYRPGWHMGDIPLATHIGIKGESGNIEFMNPSHVWAEVDVSADKSYQGEANANGANPKTGKINYAKADIKKIPEDGYYRFKTNPNMLGNWIIGGSIKVNRVLADEEAARIVREAGYEPLPRAPENNKYSLKESKAKLKELERLQEENISNAKQATGEKFKTVEWYIQNGYMKEDYRKEIFRLYDEIEELKYADLKGRIRANEERKKIGYYKVQKSIKDDIILDLLDMAADKKVFFRYQNPEHLLKKGQKSWGMIYSSLTEANMESSQIEKGKSSLMNPLSLYLNYNDKYSNDRIVVAFEGEFLDSGYDNEDIAYYNKKIAVYKAKDFNNYFKKINEQINDTQRPVSIYDLQDIIENNPNNNPDIKYQLKNNQNNKDIERLKEVNARLKEQFKLTKGVKLDKKAVKKLSSSILKDYGSSYSRAEMESRLYNLYDKIANDTIDFEDMQAETHSIARDILENASALDDSMHKEYAELRKTLRNTSITLPDKYKVDFNVYGGFDSFRKKNFGRMNLTNDGMGVDSFYQELSEMYPELFLKDVSNPSDQLMLMSDVLDGLMPIYENPFDRDMNTAVEYLAAELFEDITVVPQAKPTFADKKKAEKKSAVDMVKFENKERIGRILDQQKAKRERAVLDVKKRYEGEAYKTWWKNKLKENDIKSHYQEMIKDLRAEKNEKIKDTASRYKERIGNIYEDRKMREVKANIARRVKRLDTLLRKPTQKKHINKALEKSIAELLVQLDFSTDRQSENTVLRLRDLRAEYEKIAKVSDEEGMQANADPYIMEALEMLNGKRLADMNLDELEIMYNVVSYFDHMVSAYNKAFIGGKWEEISTKSSSILGELQTDKPVTESAYDRVQAFKDMANWGMLTPQMFFRRMGNTFTELYSDIRTSLDKKIENTKITQDYMKNLLKNVDKKTLKSWTGDKAEVKVFNIGGGKRVELTPAQVMSLYLLVQREQARGHIFGLGIKAAPVITKDSKGVKHIKKQFEPARVTPVDVQKMVASLSKEQRKIADGIGKFLNTYSKQWVNEATLQNYGYELAKEENYFPIKSDKDFLKSDFDVTSLDPTFTSMGFLKNIVKGAGNAIIIEDIFDVLTEHADKAATYNAFLTATENMKKVINFRTETQSIKQSMSKKFGLQAFRYLEKLMHDLQGGIRVESGAPMVNSMLRATKRAVLGLNVRTIVQQPTALIRASAMINPEYLAKGIAQKVNMDEMLEHSPIAKWKSWGYFTLDTGRTMKDIILDTQPILDKQYNLIQKADDITWTKLWNAVKLEISDTMPELKLGSRGYFEAVSKRFSDIIDETQVVDTVLHRSDLMRQKDFSWKILTNFMAEPTKSFNLLLNSIETYNSNRTSENRDRMIRTLSAYAATTLVNTFIISMVDLWRDKEGDKELIGTWIENILNEVTGLLPIVRDAYSLLEGYSIKRMEYEGIEKLARSWNRTIAYVKEMAEGDDHKYPARLIVKDGFEAVGYIAGVGVKNVNRELEAILRNYMKFTGDDDSLINGVYEFMFMK